MLVMGIDPGTAICGWGVIDSDGDAVRLVDYGAITTEAGLPLATRLQFIYWGLDELMHKHKPDAVAVEQLFFSKNVTTALAVGHARGPGASAPARGRADGGGTGGGPPLAWRRDP